MDLEPAIPAHLQTARTRPCKTPPNAVLPYPTYVARFKPSLTQVTMCYIGVQYPHDRAHSAHAARHRIAGLLALPGGPSHWDSASYIDQANYGNIVIAAYWDDPAAYASWSTCSEVESWWQAPERLSGGLGFFWETYAPSASGFETHFSTSRLEGVAVLSNGMSGEIREHAYWGSARDRIALSQSSAMAPSELPNLQLPGETRGHRIVVEPPDNLCIIRSGQDWTDSDSEERALYDQSIRPHLEAGMDFLRDHGSSVGCYQSRFMRVTDEAGDALAKSYGMSMWRSLTDLEVWASTHPTHLAIFSAGVAYMKKLGALAGLRTYHEISVVRNFEQSFEYVNCHRATGMLNATRRDS